MHVNDALRVEIDREISGLKNMEVGSEKLSVAVNDVTKLYDRLIETERMESEAYEKAEARKAARNDRIIGHTLTGISIIGGLIMTGVCFYKSIEFEKTGTITTFVGRLMQGRALGKK